jgi:dienelactone hydrolase
MAMQGRRVQLLVVVLSAFLVASCGGGGGTDDDVSAAVTGNDDAGNTGGNNETLPPNQRPDPTPPGGGGPGDPDGGQWNIPPGGDPVEPGVPPLDPPPGGGDDLPGDPPGEDPPPDDEPAELYRTATGPEPAATPAILTLHDFAHDNDLDMRVSWPVEGSSLPLIVFSHGNEGSMLAYDPIITHWVSYGYVVIQPDHPDSYLVPEEDRAHDYEDWEERIEEVEFILDALDQIEASIPALAGKIDRDRIGMAGHSFGAHTTQLVSGAILVTNDTFLDPRIKVALMISPQGISDALDEDSWSSFTNPMMVITGTNDTGREGQPWTWRMDPYNFSPADGDKHAVIIDGAYHNFGDIYGFGELPPDLAPDAGPLNPTHVSYVQSATIAFLDAYLKEMPAAQEYLAGTEMEAASGGEIDYERK